MVAICNKATVSYWITQQLVVFSEFQCFPNSGSCTCLQSVHQGMAEATKLFHLLRVLAPSHNPHMPGRGQQGHPQTLMSSSVETKEQWRERYNGNLKRWLVLLLYTMAEIYSSNNNQMVQIRNNFLVSFFFGQDHCLITWETQKIRLMQPTLFRRLVFYIDTASMRGHN